MTSHACDIAFITVNYNTRALVEDMLQFFSCEKLPFSHRLVVVDNNSSDGSHELLSARTDVTYIPAGENLGYGRGINRGIRAVDSTYICVLNTDIVLSADSLIQLWEFLEHNPEAQIVSPRITNRDGSVQGFIFQKSMTSIIFNTYNKIKTTALKMKLARARAPLKVQGVLGAFFVIRRSIVPATGLFDEDFFFYFEDTDLAHRLFDAGAACYALPSCSLVHLGGSSTSIEGARKFFQSKHLYLKKHYGKSFALKIRMLDRLRLRVKLLKYTLLTLFVASQRIADKKAYYAAMQQAAGNGGRP